MAVLKFLALASVAMGAFILLDFNLPRQHIIAPVTMKVPDVDGGGLIRAGGREATISAEVYNVLSEGDDVEIEHTPMLGCTTRAWPANDRALWADSEGGRSQLLVAAIIMLFPLTMFLFGTNSEDPTHNMVAFALCIAPSYIISLVAAGMWLKLGLTHLG
jgi:hypothetical protein